MKFVFVKSLLICLLICSSHAYTRNKHKTNKRNKKLFFGLFGSGPDTETIENDVKLTEIKDSDKSKETLMFLHGFFSTVGITYSNKVADALKLAYNGAFEIKKVELGNKQFSCFIDIFKVSEENNAIQTDEKSIDDEKICKHHEDSIGKFTVIVMKYRKFAGLVCDGQSLKDFLIKPEILKDIVKSLKDKYPGTKDYRNFEYGVSSKEDHCAFRIDLQKFEADLVIELLKIDCSKVAFDKNTGLLSKIAQKINNPLNVLVFCFKCAVEKFVSDIEDKIKNIIGSIGINALDFLLGRSITLVKLFIITVKVFVTLYKYFYESDQYKRLEYLGNIFGYGVRAGLEILSFPFLENIWGKKKTFRIKRLKMKLNKK